MPPRFLLVLAAAFTTATVSSAQTTPTPPDVKVIRVTDGVYMLQGSGGNIGLSVGLDDAFIVDDQYAPMTPKIKAAIATVTRKPVRFVLNTHWHPDHTGGNENMSSTGAVIVAHENVRRRMTAEQFIEAIGQRVPPSPRAALPVVTFPESLTLHVNGDSVTAMHARNAHTDGDVLVTFQKANVIHMGDTFFNGMYPFIDLSTGGSVRGTISAADWAIEMSNATTRFIPGHGPLGTREDLVAYRDMLKGVTENIARLVSEGKTLEQALAAKPSAAYDAKWGGGFMKPGDFLSIVYQSLKAANSER